ncbi:hypothetical protein AN958_00331 [Leucoagaricus sp. SymC.cos]|nr:hypothetical protein AN958_00331 [Leucoagaricus sp. SymC.cos]
MEWTASRIARLLRPLKAKCLALSSYLKGTQAKSITAYGGRRFGGDQELMSLELPSNIGIRIHFSQDAVQNFELSKRICAVRDCYYDIVCKDETIVDGNMISGALSPLTSLCSVILGAQIPCEDETTETDTSPIGEALYQAIPPPYRLRTLLMHALHIILESCPPNASLYLSLLDVVLERQLYHESEVLLDAILEYAIDFPRNNLPRISNPAYRKFLVNLYADWNTRFSSSTFVRLVTVALQRSPSEAVWTSKATRRLARKLGRYDTTTLPTLLTGLMEVVFTRRRSSKSTSQLEIQLREWFILCAEICIASVCDSPGALVSNLNQNLLEGVIGYLHSRVSYSAMEGGPDDPCAYVFSDSMACLYILWLSSGKREKSDDDAVHARFQHLTPSSDMFNPVCNYLLRNKSLSDCEDILLTLSSTCLDHDLPKLKASLWACALHHIEETEIEHININRNGRESVRSFKLRAVDYVEEAERGCFESTLPPPLSREWGRNAGRGFEGFSPHFNRTQDAPADRWPRNDGHNQDDVPSTPKRRKITQHTSPSPPHLDISRRFPSYTSTDTNTNGGPIRRLSFPAERLHNFCASPDPPATELCTHPLPFLSLLGKALSSRASIHVESEKLVRNHHGNKSTSISGTAIDVVEDNDDSSDSDDDDIDDVGKIIDHAPSEDHLDLFRIPVSSPIVK